MNKPKLNAQTQYFFASNASFQHFDQFRLTKHNQNLIDIIPYSQQKGQKVRALISGCIRRNNKLLYKGEKYYVQDLQLILRHYTDVAPLAMKQNQIALNPNKTKVLIQCHNCGGFTQQNKYCPHCQNVHYCHEGCEMKIKFTHERQQCRLRPFAMTYKALQVQIHLGSDLGRDVQLCFQHQVSMSLLLRGEKLLENVLDYFCSAEKTYLLDDYQIKKQNKSLKFQKQIKNTQVVGQEISIEGMEDIRALYTNNRILRQLQLFLLRNGAILWKNVREAHDSHFREIFLFHYP